MKYLGFSFISIIWFTELLFSQTSWSLMSVPGISWKNDVFFVDSSNGYIIGENGEIYKTTNGGVNWNQQVSGISTYIRSIYFVNHDTGYVVGNNNTLLRTINGGTNWNSISTGIEGIYDKVLFVTKNTGFIITYPAKVLKTTNSGSNWNISIQLGTGALGDIFFINENTGFVCGYNYIMKTTNQGSNWISFPSPPAVHNIYFINETTGFAYADILIGPNPPHPELVVFKTSDSGLNWYNCTPYPSVKGSATSITFLNENLGYIGYYPYSSGEYTGLLKTVDAGNTWYQQLLSGATINSICFVNINLGFAVGSASYKTTNGGSLITYSGSTSSSLRNYLIFQNYPNPFNPVTKINYDIPKNSIVKLTIYDILGKEVVKLVNNEFKQPGRYVVEFNGTNFASGVYFYRIEVRQAGSSTVDFVMSMKMVLVK